jgi:hypothetical protein
MNADFVVDEERREGATAYLPDLAPGRLALGGLAAFRVPSVSSNGRSRIPKSLTAYRRDSFVASWIVSSRFIVVLLKSMS